MKLVAILLLAACDPAFWGRSSSQCTPGVITAEYLGNEATENRAVKRLTFAMTSNHICHDAPLADLVVTRDGAAQPAVPFKRVGRDAYSDQQLADLELDALGEYAVAIDHRSQQVHAKAHVDGPWRVRVESVPLFGGGHRREVHFDFGVHPTSSGIGVSRWVSDNGRDPAWRVEWYRDGVLTFADHGRDSSGIAGGAINSDSTWWGFDRERYPSHLDGHATWEVRIFRDNAPAIGVRSTNWRALYALAPELARPALALLAKEPARRTSPDTAPMCRPFPNELRALQRSAEVLAKRKAVNAEEHTRRDDAPSTDYRRLEINGRPESNAHQDARIAHETAVEDAAWAAEEPRIRARTMALCAKLGPLVAAAARGEEPAPAFR